MTKFSIVKAIFILVNLVLLMPGVSAQDRGIGVNEVYPSDMFIENGGRLINVNTSLTYLGLPNNAMGDGIHDDSDAIISAMDWVVDQLKDWFAKAGGVHWHKYYIIYFPDGIYRVSKPLVYSGDRVIDPIFPNTTNREGVEKLMLVGQSRENTIIKLVDNAPGFGVTDSKPVVSFSRFDLGTVFNNMPATMQFRNFTIDTGTGNPGAIGLDYHGANVGRVDNIRIMGDGKIGFHIRIGSAHGYYSNVIVEGMEFGIYMEGNEESHPTMEYITLKNQKAAGVYLKGMSATMRKVQSINTVNGVRLVGNGNKVPHLAIVDGSFEGGRALNTAVQIDAGFLFARNINIQGYGSAIRQQAKDLARGAIEEFVMGEITTFSENRVRESAIKSMNLPIEEYPIVPWVADFNQWANVNNFPGSTATEKIQNAMNSGKKVVYFPDNEYAIDGTVDIPATVEQVIGSCAYLKGSGALFNINSSSANLLLFHGINLNGGYIRQTAHRNLLLETTYADNAPYISNLSSQGTKVFANNTHGLLREAAQSKNVQMWIRYNNNEKVGNWQFTADPGSQIVMLGFKAEKTFSVFRILDGAKFEVIGGVLNRYGRMPDAEQVGIYNQNGHTSLVFCSNGPNRNWSPFIEDKQENETQVWQMNHFPRRGWDENIVIPLYASYNAGVVDDYLDLNQNGIKDPYEDPQMDPQNRAADLVSRLALKEKASLMASNAAAVPRLGIPEFGWDNEGKHAIVSCFPTSIGLAATWNSTLLGSVAQALSDEARIMSRKEVEQGNRLKWLSFWAPTINMARDPRWGRTMESYGEDPYLQSEMAIAFVKAFQGDDPRYLKAVAGANHYAVYNRELGRHELDAVVEDEKMLREYYLQSFEKCVKQAHNAAIGATNNAVNGTPACVNEWLLTHVLREEWGFDGYVFSDAGSLSDVAGIRQHVETHEEAMALAVKAGLDIDCGRSFETWLEKSVLDGLAIEKLVDQSLIRSFTVRFRLGMFDPPHMNPYSQIPDSLLDGSKHRELARQAAQEAIVLLKNEQGLLPFNSTFQKIVLAGPLADQPELGRKQHGRSSKDVSLFEGLKIRFGEENVSYSKSIEQSLEQVMQADVIVYTASVMEGEVADQFFLRLSDRQERDILRLAETGKPLVVVLNSGSMVDVSPWAEKVRAIVAAWYLGEEGGNAIADVISGDVNPSGKLPLTYYSLDKPLPAFDDFDISKGRTYQYLDQNPVFPFGFGLSYTTFKIDLFRFKPTKNNIRLEASVTNIGLREGAEVVQLYLSYKGDGTRVFPKKQLKKFAKIYLKPGEKKQIEFVLTPDDLAFFDNKLNYKVFKGEYEIVIGNSSQNIAAKRNFRINRESVLKTGPILNYAELELPNQPLKSGTPFVLGFVCRNLGEITGKPEIILDGKPAIIKDQFIGPGKSKRIVVNFEVYGSGLHTIQLPGQNPVEFVIDEGAADFVVSAINIPQLGSIESPNIFEYNIINKGGHSGLATVDFQINGQTHSQEKMELKPGESRTVQFTHIFSEPGVYSIAIKGGEPLSFFVGAEVKAPYKVFTNSEGQCFQIGENSYWAEYKGAIGGTPVHNNYGGRTSLDRYGVVYIPGGMTENSSATVRIHRMSLEVSNYSKVGIMVRNRIEQPEESSGYCTANIHAYYGGGGLFEWDSDSDGYLDAIERFSVSSFPNKWIRLEKHKQTFTVWTSSDGLNWKKQLDKEIPNADSVQDVGVFVVSDHPHQACKAIFSDFKVVPIKEKLKENDFSVPEQMVRPFTTEPL